MARLNEPAESQELDSLKRRFLRQNKDLARSNATLSQRIRNLENEVSKLLSDNLNLRQQLGRAQRISECAGDIKSQLEAKMLELGALITGIGGDSALRSSPQRVGKITRSSPATSPKEKNWKNMCTLSEAVHGQEGRLPPILENKYYPRKTLEREEILAIADSPDDIGPPPVSQFVDEDPVKIDLPRRTKKEENEEPQVLDPTLSVNLEQRRRRKDSTAPSELSRLSKVGEPQASREGTTPLRIGAKRKLSVREDEEVPTRPEAVSPDDFKYTRVINEEGPRKTLSENAVRKVTKEINASNEGTKDKVPAATIPTTRKILAPKSVNDSPRKTAKVMSEDGKPGKGGPVKPITAKDWPKERKPEPVKVLPLPEPMGETIEVQLEPETPAAADLFSPLSSQPSTARVESRDTPPPVDLGSEAEGHRPSRRARGAVSYAEPNLRDKMRRPTKELVDAVGKDGKPRRETAIKLESDIAPEPKDPTIKPEPEADDAWKQMPVATSTTVENSPLGSKAAVPELLPSSITTHRRRRESLLNNMDLDSARSGSATAIAALLAESRKAKAAAREKAAESDALVAMTSAPLDIYEFKGSSPAPVVSIEQPIKTEKSVPPRFSRRQSTTVRNTPTPEEGEASDMEAPKRPVSASISSRRQSALGLRSTSATSLRPSDRDKDGGKSLKRSTSTTAMPDAATNNTASRNERIAARRRSMML